VPPAFSLPVQRTGTVSRLADELAASQSLYLWWD
jgi:hypothetical protein